MLSLSPSFGLDGFARMMHWLRAFRRPLVVSFPKSGRTWLRVMLDELGLRFEYTHAQSGHRDQLKFNDITPPDHILGRRKIIFLHRDPRDTVVSGYFQATKRLRNFSGSISDFIRDPRHGIEKVVLFNRSWLLAATSRDDVCVMSYEDLHEDTVGEVKRIVSFLGKSVTDQDIQTVVDSSRFDLMQRREASGGFGARYGGILTPRDVADKDSFKVRRGKVGGWRDYLSSEDAAYSEQIIADYIGGSRAHS